MKYKVGDKIVFNQDCRLAFGQYIPEGATGEITDIVDTGLTNAYRIKMKDYPNSTVPTYKVDEKCTKIKSYDILNGLINSDSSTDGEKLVEEDKMKYKVGDKVRIRKDLTEDLYGSLAQYAGLMAKIKAVNEDADYYLIDIDGGLWRWTDDAFENKDTDKTDKTIRPDYYKFHGYDVFDIADHFGLDFPLGNALKYLLRCKHKQNEEQDLHKAIKCIERHLEMMKQIRRVDND